MVYQLGSLVAHAISINFSKHASYPPIYEVFPSLFEPPKPKVQDWQLMKARIEAYNQKRGEHT